MITIETPSIAMSIPNSSCGSVLTLRRYFFFAGSFAVSTNSRRNCSIISDADTCSRSQMTWKDLYRGLSRYRPTRPRLVSPFNFTFCIRSLASTFISSFYDMWQHRNIATIVNTIVIDFWYHKMYSVYVSTASRAYGRKPPQKRRKQCRYPGSLTLTVKECLI